MGNWIEKQTTYVWARSKHDLRIACCRVGKEYKVLTIYMSEVLFLKMNNISNFNFFWDDECCNKMKIEFSNAAKQSFKKKSRTYKATIYLSKYTALNKIDFFKSKNIDYKIEDNNLYFEI